MAMTNDPAAVRPSPSACRSIRRHPNRSRSLIAREISSLAVAGIVDMPAAVTGDPLARLLNRTMSARRS